MMSVRPPAKPLDYDGIKRLSRETDRTVDSLLALSRDVDPFYVSPARLRKAQWFAEWWQRLGLESGVHVRRVHYLLVSQREPVEMPVEMLDRRPYENSTQCWHALAGASADARYLGLVPATDFIDQRNDEPLIHIDVPMQFEAAIDVIGEVPYVHVGMPLPPRLALEFDAPTVAQRYHVEIWCEKTTVNDVLGPLARQYGLNVVTGAGELSITACVRLVDRTLRSERPTRILYVSDFDPAGRSMPVAVSRKIEHRLYQLGRDLDIQVRHVALTPEQVAYYELPRTPIKDVRRGAAFEKNHGEGGVELDALEALHPGALRRILVREIERYHDRDLADRVSEQADETAHGIRREIARVQGAVRRKYRAELGAIETGWKDVEACLDAWRSQAEPLYERIASELAEKRPDVPDVEWPEPVEGDEDDDPLFDARRSYIEQADRYKRYQRKSIDRGKWKRTA